MAETGGDEHLRRRYGISRRDFLRRGAIVGGTLAWTIPVISSISRAHQAKGSPLSVCCWCRPNRPKNFNGGCAPSSVDSQSQCSQYCKQISGNAKSKPEFHSQPQSMGPIPCHPQNGCGPHTAPK